MMTTFLTTLLTMTTAATVAALGVMVLRGLLKGAPRWITCALWLVVLFRMVCPVSFQVPVSVTDAVTAGLEPAAIVQVEDTAGTTAEAAAIRPLTPAAGPEAPALPPETLETPGPANTVSIETILFVLWALGAGGMLLWAVLSYGHLRKKVSEAVLTGENVYETDQVEAPFVCGFLRPRIYLPVGLGDQDKAYVLLHEEAHIRRRDYLTKPLAWLALSLHWFNPVLWLAYRLYCRDVETACDQAVIRRLDRDHTAGYAAALLHLGRKTRLPQAVPLAFGEEDAKGRIQGVLNYKRPRFWVICGAILACIAGAVFLLADGSGQGRVDGHTVDFVSAQAQGTTTALPEDLAQDLMTLLNTHGHGDYEELKAVPEETGIRFYTGHRYLRNLYFDPDAMTLTTENWPKRGGMDKDARITYQVAPMNPSLARDPAYQAWLEDYEDFWRYGRADYTYDLAVSDAADREAMEELLWWLNLPWYGGVYTMDFQPDTGTLSIALGCYPAFREEEKELQRYLDTLVSLLPTLVDNVETVEFRYEDPFGGWGITGHADPEDKGLTREEFRDRYDRFLPYLNPNLALEERMEYLWYVDPEMDPKPCDIRVRSYNLVDVEPKTAQEMIFSIAPEPAQDLESLELTEYHFKHTTDKFPLTDKEGNVVLDLNDYEQVEVVYVMDGDYQLTGYTLYRLDGVTWLSYAPKFGALAYLMQLRPDGPYPTHATGMAIQDMPLTHCVIYSDGAEGQGNGYLPVEDITVPQGSLVLMLNWETGLVYVPGVDTPGVYGTASDTDLFQNNPWDLRQATMGVVEGAVGYEDPAGSPVGTLTGLVDILQREKDWCQVREMGDDSAAALWVRGIDVSYTLDLDVPLP